MRKMRMRMRRRSRMKIRRIPVQQKEKFDSRRIRIFAYFGCANQIFPDQPAKVSLQRAPLFLTVL
ncbi:unnamed protein product [Staurois parvus]|uniref:Uncharacterized protein n=1 Tax=Staurois parvus TaxID=386267 RepID=A0ABN9GFH6_9NEOB|nr:unnamed protein product [Staurois parvus]